ncbi:PIR Superfamily Protein [Plasmodium ovale wallikeri]|uniref:PIR Superfamily Protein n=1 Tax=Plasmodium ovale wallikeri TaxID=864142 RepID=A0A1A9APM3_PLAOA|nr:PIR Superfamily Protein [Plasmodium ovale wallikeri]SBT58697.1 PIR Superfamily Protein [Plasmodium ovale wallikeri]
MGKEDEELGIFVKNVDYLEDEEEGEEDEVDIVEAGENYYSSVGSFHVYEKEFNTIVVEKSNTQKYEQLCKSFSDVFFSSNYPTDRCYMIAKYLYYIKLKTDQNHDDRCKCLNYLLNTKENFKSITNYEVSKLLKAYSKLASKFKTCDNIIEHIKSEDVLGKIEKLYTLHKSLGKLEKSIDENDGNMYSNAEEFANKYENCNNYCKDSNSNDYCEEIEKIKLYCYHHTNSKNCAEIAKLLKYQQELKRSVKIIVPCIIILGTPIFLYILHKFTSFGSRFNTFLIKNKIIQHNINEETTDQFFEYTHEAEGRDIKYHLHHIGYHTT